MEGNKSKRKRIQGGYKNKTVADIKEPIQAGDMLKFKFMCIDINTGKRPRGSRTAWGHIKTKYPYIMEAEISGKKNSRGTAQYAEALTGEAEWEGRRRCDEGDYRI